MEIAMSQGFKSASDESGADERIGPRQFSEIPVTITGSSGLHLAGVMENLSETGCLISLFHQEAPATGKMIGCKVEGYPSIMACVTWSNDNVFGARFCDRIEPDLVHELVRRSLLARLAAHVPSKDRLQDLPSAQSIIGRRSDMR